jgi:carbamoyltransferase
MDLAASIQAVTEDAVLKLTRAIARETSLPDLCLAGGVALNCVANGKVLRDGAFKRLWIQPAAGDSGGALGAALAAHHLQLAQPREATGADTMQGSYLGPEFDGDDVARRLKTAGARFARLDEAGIVGRSAEALAAGRALGWFQGRMEFGPRALGARSILGDARSPTMQSVLNLKVKYRESFRPFAPAVVREDVADWFELGEDSPYMLLVADVREKLRREMTPEERALFGIEKLNVPRSVIPAVTHVDYSARVQTVHRETNPRFHGLISEFKRHTGCPVIVNTSFNVRGEPIVCTPEDAFRCFMGTEIDCLAVEDCFLVKDDQDPALRQRYHQSLAPD